MEDKYKKLQNLNKKELAEWLHNSYEEISKKKNWDTQNKCKVKFDDLPEENKQVMMSMARKIHKNI